MTTIGAQAICTPDRRSGPGGLDVDADGRIIAVRDDTDHTADGVLIPGFVDLQCNGANGADLAACTAEAFDRAGTTLLASGTTAWCPTLPSAPPETYPRFLDAPAAAASRPGPRVLGVHLEGPFLNPVRAGAHPPACLRPPDPGWLASLLDRHPGLVRIVTLAPELPGAQDVIRLCVERGVVVAVGHSDATAGEAAAAFDAGATMLTHLFNAMRPIHHRDPGVGGAALAHPGVRCSLIADGVHVHAALVAFYARALGPRRTVLVSDAIASPSRDPLDGGFELLGGALANMLGWGIPFEDAVRMATATPADALGTGDVGLLGAGAYADAVLWRDGVAAVWLGGESVWTNP